MNRKYIGLLSKWLKRLLYLALILTILLSSLMLSAKAEEAKITIPVSSLTELFYAVSSDTGSALVTVELIDNIVFSTDADVIFIPGGKTVKLTSSDGGPFTIDANKLNRVIYVESGAELILENIWTTGGRIIGGGVYNKGFFP